jgi:hypothetical protein
MRAAGFRCDDITATKVVAKVLRLVRRRFTAEQSGRGPLCVVRMTRVHQDSSAAGSGHRRNPILADKLAKTRSSGTSGGGGVGGETARGGWASQRAAF